MRQAPRETVGLGLAIHQARAVKFLLIIFKLPGQVLGGVGPVVKRGRVVTPSSVSTCEEDQIRRIEPSYRTPVLKVPLQVLPAVKW